MTNHVDRRLGTSPAQLVQHRLDGLLLARARPAGTELPEQTPPSGQPEEVGRQREQQRQEGDGAGNPGGGILGNTERPGDPVGDEEAGEDMDQLEREAEEVERQRDHRVLLASCGRDLFIQSQRCDRNARRSALGDDEALPHLELTDLVGVDPEGVLLAQAAQPGRSVLGRDLDGPLDARPGAGSSCETFGVGALVADEPGRGVEDPVGSDAEAGVGLAGDDHRRSEASDSLEEVGGVGVHRQRRELVHDQQHPPVDRLAACHVVGEVLDQEPAEAGGLLLEGETVEQHVGGVGVLERPALRRASLRAPRRSSGTGRRRPAPPCPGLVPAGGR